MRRQTPGTTGSAKNWTAKGVSHVLTASIFVLVNIRVQVYLDRQVLAVRRIVEAPRQEPPAQPKKSCKGAGAQGKSKHQSHRQSTTSRPLHQELQSGAADAERNPFHSHTVPSDVPFVGKGQKRGALRS